MLYTAQHLSLACIDVLVHLDKSQLPRDCVWSKTELSAAPTILAFESLSSIVSCQAAGHAWVNAVRQLAIRVPSVSCAVTPRPFRFDPRLFIAEPHTL